MSIMNDARTARLRCDNTVRRNCLLCDGGTIGDFGRAKLIPFAEPLGVDCMDVRPGVANANGGKRAFGRRGVGYREGFTLLVSRGGNVARATGLLGQSPGDVKNARVCRRAR